MKKLEVEPLEVAPVYEIISNGEAHFVSLANAIHHKHLSEVDFRPVIELFFDLTGLTELPEIFSTRQEITAERLRRMYIFYYAPKYRIEKYEKDHRAIYGNCIIVDHKGFLLERRDIYKEDIQRNMLEMICDLNLDIPIDFLNEAFTEVFYQSLNYELIKN